MGKTSQRNYGIDLLRIVSMMLVAMLHILGHGGILKAAQGDGVFSTVWFLEILAYPAVNCFVLISGYVGYRPDSDRLKLKNLVSLFFTVLFYSVIICLIFNYFYPAEILRENITASFFPVATRQYWFFSCYFAAFLLTPVLNVFIDKASDKALIFTGISVFALFSLYSPVFTRYGDAFALSNGYSMIWFLLVYLLGGIMKKLGVVKRVSKLKSFIILTVMLTVTWLTRIIPYLCDMVSLKKYAGIFVSYISPTVLIMAVALFCLFANMNVKGKIAKAVGFFSGSAFSVYLIHDNLYFRKYIMSGSFAWVAEKSPLTVIGVVLSSAVCIFAGCALIDKLRELLFKLLRIDRLAQWLESIIDWVFDRIHKNYTEKSE